VPTETANAQETRETPLNWWRVGDGVVLLAYASVVLWTIRYHEKWADEAQAWLIARDLNLPTIWFHELRYEGSPGLWHTILWAAQHVFHANYDTISYIGAFFAIVGAALLVFLAPFPRVVRWPMAFGYVLVYQYAVIARPYTLMAVLAFSAALLFKDIYHPERITLVLILLTLTSLHGATLAGCLGLAYLIRAIRCWPEMDESVKRRFLMSATVLGFTFLLLVIILKPTPDVEEFAMKKLRAQLPAAQTAEFASVPVKLEAVLSGAFLDFVFPSILFVLLAGAFCALRKRFLEFALPVGSLLILYVAVHGYSQHQGTVTIAAITGLWIAWPTTQERAASGLQLQRATYGVVGLLLLFCTVQIWDSVVAIHHEYLYPYSGAEDAAKFLKEAGADKGSIYGFSYGIAGIQPFFDHNIFTNVPTSYFHHGLPLYGKYLDLAEVDRVLPEYVVIFEEDPQRMIDLHIFEGFESIGYQMVHFSDGYQLYRRSVYLRQTYFIFRRPIGQKGITSGTLPLAGQIAKSYQTQASR
jgi:hypothetical protein